MMKRHHLNWCIKTPILISLLSMACGCEFDVTRDPKYQHGWVPGHQYELRHTMAVMLDKQTGDVYFDRYRADKPVGSVWMRVNNYQQVLVENAPAGTRFRVDKLIR